ncbi:MAG: RNA pseudouridine synthase [Deltaproteobacteria bacterium]|nr:RNA pseudouridine synthase [Deltaproteobacteria bacterium]
MPVRSPDILFRSDEIILADKPAGILTTGEKGDRDTLEARIQAGFGPGVKALHRLDRETSGVVALAAGEAARRRLEPLFRRHETERVYLALVLGTFRENEGSLRNYLRTDPRTHTEQVTYNPRFGVEARLGYRVLQSAGGASLLEIRPETGRTNQIRVQLAHDGHPVIGDRKYGRGKIYPAMARRTMLHARSLALLPPGEKKKVRATSPLPDDFREALAELAMSAKGLG